MYLPPAAQDWLAFGHSSWPAACRELGARGWGMECLKLLGTDLIPDKAYLKWWIDQVALPSSDGLADHAELLAKIDARKFVGDIKVPMLILAPTTSRMAPLDGPDSQRDLQARVKGSKLVAIGGAEHEIYVDRAEECQKAYLEFLAALE